MVVAPVLGETAVDVVVEPCSCTVVEVVELVDDVLVLLVGGAVVDVDAVVLVVRGTVVVVVDVVVVDVVVVEVVVVEVVVVDVVVLGAVVLVVDGTVVVVVDVVVVGAAVVVVVDGSVVVVLVVVVVMTVVVVVVVVVVSGAIAIVTSAEFESREPSDATKKNDAEVAPGSGRKSRLGESICAGWSVPPVASKSRYVNGSPSASVACNTRGTSVVSAATSRCCGCATGA